MSDLDITRALAAEANRAWPSSSATDRGLRRRFHKIVNRALFVLHEAGFELQPMPPRKPWPHDETVFHIWTKQDTVDSLDSLRAFLRSCTPEQREGIEVRSGWRNETGDYMLDLLSLQDEWQHDALAADPGRGQAEGGDR